MPLELNEVFVTLDSRLPVNETFIFDDISSEGEELSVSPVNVTGQITNKGGLVELTYTADFTYSKPCDRCLTVVEKKACYDFSHTLALSTESEDSDDIIIVSEYLLDLCELVREDILLKLPVKHLCSEDCLGLCSQCGQNLNLGKCSCNTKAVDPRLAVLDELLLD